MFTPTADEIVLVSQIFTEVELYRSKPGSHSHKKRPFDKDNITTKQAIDIFEGAKVQPSVVEQILELVDPAQKGKLTRKELGLAVRLLGWAQEGVAIEQSLVDRCGPLPFIHGLPIIHNIRRPKPKRQESSSETSQSPTKSSFPPLTPDGRARYRKVFNKAGPVDGILKSKNVWKALTISRLPADTLSHIWNLADPNKTGDLNLDEFVVAMYFVEGLLSKRFTSLPDKVPDYVVDEAQNPSVPVPASIYTTAVAPIAGPSRQKHKEKSRPKPSSKPNDYDQDWAVPLAVQKSASTFFDALDTHAKGHIQPDSFTSHMLTSGLSSGEVERIWYLSDIRSRGRLRREEFALAVWLMHRKLAGLDIPDILPPSFLPPSRRAFVAQLQRNWAGSDESSEEQEMSWTVPDPVLANAASCFDVLDLDQQGYIKEDVVIPFLTDSELPSQDLAEIWTLVDRKGKGRLNRADFTALLFLLHRTLAGLPLPDVLPESVRLVSEAYGDEKKKQVDWDSDVESVKGPSTQSLLSVRSEYDHADFKISRDESSPSRPGSSKLPPVVPPRPQQTTGQAPPIPAKTPKASDSTIPPLETQHEDLQSEVLRLRAMIKGLRDENTELRQSVHTGPGSNSDLASMYGTAQAFLQQGGSHSSVSLADSSNPGSHVGTPRRRVTDDDTATIVTMPPPAYTEVVGVAVL